MAAESLHEDPEKLSDAVLDRHRAIRSLMEELEAVDWYDQRAAACKDPELRAILEHNRDEEKEHAAMVLEWLRRNDPGFDENLRAYLFTERSLTSIEHHETGKASGAGSRVAEDERVGSATVGNLRRAHEL